MNTFGDFLFTLRKEKGMTQAELAEMLGVTNKAVSKWETGEAMPETGLLMPISRIFGVTVDELLDGKRAEPNARQDDVRQCDGGERISEAIKGHLFTRGKDDTDNKSLTDKICGAVCAAVFFIGVAAYLLIGVLLNAWHPYWIIVSVSSLTCGIIGIIFDLCNRSKRERKQSRGENPYVGGVCGLVMLSCIIAYLCIGAFTGLWHPYWLVIVGGVFFCGITGAIGGIFVHNKNDK